MDHKQKNGDPAKIAAPQSTTQPPTPSFIVSLAKSVDDKQARVNATPELATVVEYIRTGRYNNAAVEVPDFPPLQPTTNKIQALFADVLKRSGGNRDAAKGAIDHLKNGLPVMLPCGEFTKQGNKFLIQASGLAPVDYDALGTRVRDVREKLQASPYCVLCQKSPSGDGVKALFRAPPTCDNTEHFQRYFTACEHVTKLTGIDPRVEDDSGKDIARRYFLCYDPDIYFNPDAQELELLPLPEAAPKAETPKADKRNKPDKELVRKLL